MYTISTDCNTIMGHSRSNQHKKNPPVSDFAEIPGVGWDYGESNPYLFVAPKVAWLPSYKSLNWHNLF